MQSPKLIQIFCNEYKIDMCKYNVRDKTFDLQEEIISIYIWEDTKKLDPITDKYQIPTILDQYYSRLNNLYK